MMKVRRRAVTCRRLCSRALLASLVLLAEASASWAQSVHLIRWPTDSSRGPALVGPPDDQFIAVAPDSEATVAAFDCGTLYANLAALLGVPVSTLAAADVIAFEGNGGSPGEGADGRAANGCSPTVWSR
jgi:hypothetical protein